VSAVEDLSYLGDSTHGGWVLWFLPPFDDPDDFRNFAIVNVNDRMAPIIDEEV
jgi:hypothetical protein